MESIGSGWPEPVVMEFPTNSPADSPARVPRRIRRRLLEAKSGSSPSSAEAIEAKLREADLRRQRFYEWLSCKARPKPRSPSWSSQEEDLSQRIQARLFAAEQKRLSLLEKAQKRLARMDELRQAAKNGVEMRIEKEREELGTRVESRARQAEENRLRLLAAHRQRRAALRERTAQTLVQRLLRESRYKERVRSAISQKRSAAEKKRLALLEAEKRRAHARVMRARRVAKAVCSQRESERLRIEQQLKDKLQRAEAYRAECMKQRGSPRSCMPSVTWEEEHGDILARKIARCWRRFVKSKRTTLSLTESYESLGLNSKSVKSMPFEQLAMLIESPATLEATKLLLERLESRFVISLATATRSVPAPQNIDHLLKHLGSPRKPSRSRGPTPKKENAGKSTKKSSSRYAVRVVLCAYMILGHPNAVFSGNSERENALVEAASGFIQEFEILVKVVLDGPDKEKSFRKQLAAFDAGWCNYLYRFVAWKVKDARALEDDLVRAACKLELSMMQTCKVTANGEMPELTHDMEAVQKQVTEDQKLLREKVHHLSGNAGLERMESALSNTRFKFFESKEKNSSRPIAHIPSPSDSDPSSSAQNSISTPDASLKTTDSSRSVARSLFRSVKEIAAAEGVVENSSVLRAESEKLPTENEILVNEILHETDGSIAGSLTSSNGDEMEIKAKVIETMEKAFWDDVMNSLKGDKPNYDRVIDLVKEVRDELCNLAPQKLRQEIFDRIDLDILSQVLDSGIDDRPYLGQILDFSLGMLRQLGSRVSEDSAKEAHQKLLSELAEESTNQTKSSFVFAIVKGLRFTLEEIKKLKSEVSKARIQMLEPLVQGTVGIEYLQKAFTDHYGIPSDSSVSLPLTARWISVISVNLEEEWGEYVNSLSALSVENNALPLVMTLRTGGAISGNQILPRAGVSSGENAELPECTGDIIDKLVRLGLLKLVCGIEGVTLQSVPETLKLNALRLRSIQSEYQKIIVIATSMLVLRQILISEKGPNSYNETAITESVQKLTALLDSSADVGIEEIVDTLIATSSPENMESKKEIMGRVLLKSLQNGDIIFNKVSASVYSALRAVALAGNGVKGRKLAEVALRKVGGVILLDRVAKAGEVLVKMAVVTGQVHGPWYRSLM